MIAARTDARRVARLEWTADARRSMRELMGFIRASSAGRPLSRRLEIETAVELLRHTPLMGEFEAIRDGMTFRRIVVGGRFNVYYTYIPSKTSSSVGTVSIRAVKHSAMERPFFGVRDTPQLPA